MMGRRTAFSGVITVETAFIVPVILLAVFLSVMGIFYYHDKNVITACAYEAAVVGGTKARERDGVTDELVAAVFEERARGKCILFGELQASAKVSETEVTVTVLASRGRMALSVVRKASVTDPEKKIRDYRKWGIRGS